MATSGAVNQGMFDCRIYLLQIVDVIFVFVFFFQHPNVVNEENAEYILPPPKPLPYSEHQARKSKVIKAEPCMEPPTRKPRAGTLPSSVPTTPTKKGAKEMPPPLAPITPRVKKTPARGTVCINIQTRKTSKTLCRFC